MKFDPLAFFREKKPMADTSDTIPVATAADIPVVEVAADPTVPPPLPTNRPVKMVIDEFFGLLEDSLISNPVQHGLVVRFHKFVDGMLDRFAAKLQARLAAKGIKL
jgi:hypothetical protein